MPAPGFVAYIIKYALPILIPVLALVGFISSAADHLHAGACRLTMAF